ncbi:unnamed protein product [Calypogeia fissa]
MPQISPSTTAPVTSRGSKSPVNSEPRQVRFSDVVGIMPERELAAPRPCIIAVAVKAHEKMQVEPFAYVFHQLLTQQNCKVVVICCLSKVRSELGVDLLIDESFSGISKTKLQVAINEQTNNLNHFLKAYKESLNAKGVELEIKVSVGRKSDEILVQAARALHPLWVVLDSSWVTFSGNKNKKIQAALACNLVLLKKKSKPVILQVVTRHFEQRPDDQVSEQQQQPVSDTSSPAGPAENSSSNPSPPPTTTEEQSSSNQISSTTTTLVASSSSQITSNIGTGTSNSNGTSPSIAIETSSSNGTTLAVIATETPSSNGTTSDIAMEMPSSNGTTPATTREMPSLNGTSPSIAADTSTVDGTTPTISIEIPSSNRTSPSTTTEISNSDGTTPTITMETPTSDGTTPVTTMETSRADGITAPMSVELPNSNQVTATVTTPTTLMETPSLNGQTSPSPTRDTSSSDGTTPTMARQLSPRFGDTQNVASFNYNNSETESGFRVPSRDREAPTFQEYSPSRQMLAVSSPGRFKVLYKTWSSAVPLFQNRTAPPSPTEVINHWNSASASSSGSRKSIRPANPRSPLMPITPSSSSSSSSSGPGTTSPVQSGRQSILKPIPRLPSGAPRVRITYQDTSDSPGNEEIEYETALAIAIQESIASASEEGLRVAPPTQNIPSWNGGTANTTNGGEFGDMVEREQSTYTDLGPGSSAGARTSSLGPSVGADIPSTSGSSPPTPTGPSLASFLHESLAPSAPPLPPDGGPIQYPSVETSPVQPSVQPVDYGFGQESGPPTKLKQKQRDEDKSSGGCIICWDAPAGAVCIPCGHLAGCENCLTRVRRMGSGCPVCRAKIQQVLRVYAV